MGGVEERLNYLEDTKELLRQEINSKRWKFIRRSSI